VRRALALTFVLLIGVFSSSAHADIVGQASVIDGDTIEIHDQRIRFFGIDAPESDQLCLAQGKQWRCGQQAALALHEKVAGRTVTCVERDRDRYGRTVAACRAGDEDINASLVAQGWAMAYRQYSTDYIGREAAARSAQGYLARDIR